MPRPIDRTRIKKILVRSTNWVGDVVMSLPALEAIGKNFPDAEIIVLARPWVTPLLKNHPAVHRVMSFVKGRGFTSDMFEIFKVSREIREQGFDLAILFQNAIQAAIIAFLGGVRNRVGYNTDGRGFLLTHPIRRKSEVRKLHQIEYYLGILRGMGWKAETRDPEIFLDPEDQRRAEKMLSSMGLGGEEFVLGLSPGAIYGPAKRWPAERFAAVADMAVENWGARVLILGSKGEKDVCSRVKEHMKHEAVDLCGKTTLGEAMVLIKACDLFLTNDSGLMHVAAALGVPLVAIFGSTNPRATGPRSQRARVVTRNVSCAPCLRKECPEDFRCMLDIEPDEVWENMETLRWRL
ncbi:MAG: lipopolysaccharide heptosyltransferase II [Deltaproteobacteria bacterium]|nr:lipopolysaccharide heptosyltransferase II [Deltaproteobacteria bacterium]